MSFYLRIFFTWYCYSLLLYVLTYIPVVGQFATLWSTLVRLVTVLRVHRAWLKTKSLNLDNYKKYFTMSFQDFFFFGSALLGEIVFVEYNIGLIPRMPLLFFKIISCLRISLNV